MHKTSHSVLSGANAMKAQYTQENLKQMLKALQLTCYERQCTFLSCLLYFLAYK
jgi:hypothetical protein